MLLHKRACATPTSIHKEVCQEPTGRRLALVVRPVNKHRAPDYEIARDKSPVAAVFAVVTIITHHEVAAVRNRDLILTLKSMILMRFVGTTWPVIDVVELA